MCAVWDLDVKDKTVIWTSTDFAWVGALGWVLPMWHFGRPIVCYPMGGFDEESAFEVLEEFHVTNTFLPPTAIRMLKQVDDPTETYDLTDLEMIATGGEPVTPEVVEWVEETLGGVRINEMYGQTEATTFISDCREWFEPKLGAIGKPGPGHDVAIVDPDTGEEKPVGEPGEIAISKDDPVVFEEYWNKPELTEASRVGNWHLTGDIGVEDEAGYISFSSRADDVIITSGYRVSPREVESAILQHPQVEDAAVIGVPDETRGKIIKGFILPVDEDEYPADLVESIQELVKNELAKYEYPREIEIVSEFPRTATGKIQKPTLREREDDE
jgi:acetyl-CoA synthetase